MSHNAGTPALESFSAYDELAQRAPRLALMLAHYPLNMSSEFALRQLHAGVPEATLCDQLLTMRTRFALDGVAPLDPESHYRSKPLRRTKP